MSGSVQGLIGYIVYGRLKSTRLPGKALLKLGGKSMVRVFIERIELSSKIDKIVFATSDLAEDTPLAELASNEGLDVYRGHPKDVVLRLYETARLHGFNYFLTTMIDTPFQLREVINATVDRLIGENYDMLYSVPSQPNGTDCYGLKTAALKRIIDMKGAIETECWGKYFTDTGIFKWGEINLFKDRPDLKEFRLTIDYPEDYDFCNKLYSDLVARFGPGFSLENLISLLDLVEYKQQLASSHELSKKWETHFDNSATPVDLDVARIKRGLKKGGEDE